MKKMSIFLFILGLVLPGLALAHFMVVQPSTSLVLQQSQSDVKIDLRFAHPFTQGYMSMAAPVQFGVLAGGNKTDLRGTLEEVKVGDNSTYTTNYKIKKPGDHIFYVEPAPYWEPAEGIFIIHYTKAIVHAFGLEEGWDDLVGFKTEIKPLTRPYGLWAGNVFQGQVLLDGKPVPGAEVEVAYDNRGLQVDATAPDVFHIQAVKADRNGVFTYVMPRAGWWGFAALSEDDKQLVGPDGKKHAVEIGALIWVQATAME